MRVCSNTALPWCQASNACHSEYCKLPSLLSTIAWHHMFDVMCWNSDFSSPAEQEDSDHIAIDQLHIRHEEFN